MGFLFVQAYVVKTRSDRLLLSGDIDVTVINNDKSQRYK